MGWVLFALICVNAIVFAVLLMYEGGHHGGGFDE